MADDRDLARAALDFQARAKDYPMTTLPGYREWSQRKLADGLSEALIAHLDGTSMCLRPEERAQLTEADFEDLLDDLRSSIED